MPRRIVLTLLAALQAWDVVDYLSPSIRVLHFPFGKYAMDLGLLGCNLGFPLSKCVYLFTEELKLLCTFALPSLFLPCHPIVLRSMIFRSKEFGFFHSSMEISSLRPRFVSWEPCTKTSFWWFPIQNSVRDLLADNFFNPFNVYHVNFVLVN